MSKHVNQENNRKKKRWMLAALILLLLLLITSCSVTIWSIFFRDTTTTLAPDYAPQEIDPNATPTPDSDKEDEKLEQEQGGGSVSLQYTQDVRADLSDGMVYFSFTNPYESNQDMVLQVVVKGKVIAQSKLLPPGNSLSKLPLREGVNLSPGGYEGKFTAAYYYENGEKAIVQTDIPLTVKVQE
ncbi:MAG: hypothetical protein IJO92_01745 [Clostridia bacterium]|nr:hypothetical protein [Clostridia bacterium]